MIVLQAIPELPCRRQSSLLLLLKETILFWGKVPIDTSNYMPIIIIICTWTHWIYFFIKSQRSYNFMWPLFLGHRPFNLCIIIVTNALHIFSQIQINLFLKILFVEGKCQKICLCHSLFLAASDLDEDDDDDA